MKASIGHYSGSFPKEGGINLGWLFCEQAVGNFFTYTILLLKEFTERRREEIAEEHNLEVRVEYCENLCESLRKKMAEIEGPGKEEKLRKCAISIAMVTRFIGKHYKAPENKLSDIEAEFYQQGIENFVNYAKSLLDEDMIIGIIGDQEIQEKINRCEETFEELKIKMEHKVLANREVEVSYAVAAANLIVAIDNALQHSKNLEIVEGESDT